MLALPVIFLELFQDIHLGGLDALVDGHNSHSQSFPAWLSLGLFKCGFHKKKIKYGDCACRPAPSAQGSPDGCYSPSHGSHGAMADGSFLFDFLPAWFR